MLRDERRRYDELKKELNNYLGLFSQDNESKEVETSEPIGGFQSSSNRGRLLSIASARKVMQDETTE